ncbi:hypothetical protein [Burkholderia sp. Ac-20379]|uniref:hypothetical protein n=1 Tax=Burkholderia sp. Ac-20379 TaxID=2703900 RepID=UPI001F12164D|nr:hypothetical protein [Burkholderia sp. Ac-20379]
MVNSIDGSRKSQTSQTTGTATSGGSVDAVVSNALGTQVGQTAGQIGVRLAAQLSAAARTSRSAI